MICFCSVLIIDVMIVAAVAGGWVLGLFTQEESIPSDVNMLVVARVLLLIDAACVSAIKEQ